MSSPVFSSKHVLKRNSMRFAATLLARLASLVAGRVLAYTTMARVQAPAERSATPPNRSGVAPRI